jgi:hypothetical protein
VAAIGFHVFERLRLANTLQQSVSQYIFNKQIYFFRVLRSSACHSTYSLKAWGVKVRSCIFHGL